jgi:hypothetical protein
VEPSSAFRSIDLEARIENRSIRFNEKRRCGKTTVTANPGAFCADVNIRSLLIVSTLNRRCPRSIAIRAIFHPKAQPAISQHYVAYLLPAAPNSAPKNE